MHRLKSSSTIYRLRWSALLLCLQWLLLPVGSVVLCIALAIWNEPLAKISIVVVTLTFLLAVIQWWTAATAGCPLCMTPVLAKKDCVKHRNARAIFGSHRLPVALTILFQNSFKCPYCHEPTVLEVRSKRDAGG